LEINDKVKKALKERIKELESKGQSNNNKDNLVFTNKETSLKNKSV
jgi:hypothetical protein